MGAEVVCVPTVAGPVGTERARPAASRVADSIAARRIAARLANQSTSSSSRLSFPVSSKDEDEDEVEAGAALDDDGTVREGVGGADSCMLGGASCLPPVLALDAAAVVLLVNPNGSGRAVAAALR